MKRIANDLVAATRIVKTLRLWVSPSDKLATRLNLNLSASVREDGGKLVLVIAQSPSVNPLSGEYLCPLIEMEIANVVRTGGQEAIYMPRVDGVISEGVVGRGESVTVAPALWKEGVSPLPKDLAETLLAEPV